MLRIVRVLAVGVAMAMAVQATAVAADRELIGIAACGLVLSESDVVFRLDSDLTCASFGFLVTGENTVFDLNGHTLKGSGSSSGIAYGGSSGSGATVRDGVITNFGEGITVEQSLLMDRFVVSNVDANNNTGPGMEIYAEPAIVKGSSALWNGSTGIALAGNSTQVTDSTASSNGGTGIKLAGSDLRVTRARAFGNAGAGIEAEGANAHIVGAQAGYNDAIGVLVNGDDVLVKDSRSSANATVGVSIVGDRARVLDSVASDNGIGGMKILPAGGEVSRMDGNKAINNGWNQATAGTYGLNVVGPAKGKNVAKRNHGVQCAPESLC